MADEAVVVNSLRIRSGYLNYQSQPTSFRADVEGSKGPVPGAITVTIAGTDVDLSELTQPALCRIQNLDDTNFVEVGIREPGTSTFYPVLEILPGESYVMRLTRNLHEEYVGTGTGTSAATNFFHIKANTAPCNVLVEAFEA